MDLQLTDIVSTGNTKTVNFEKRTTMTLQKTCYLTELNVSIQLVNQSLMK